MSQYYLVSFFLIVFIVIGSVGFRASKFELWNYVDLIYYPLAAIGVLLLFQHQAADRKILLLAEERQKLVSTIRQIESDEPYADPNSLTPSFLKLTRLILSHLEHIPRMSNLCGRSGSLNQKCRVARTVGPIVEKHLHAFKFKDKEFSLFKICSASENLLRELTSKNALGAVATSTLKKHYIAGLKKNFYQYDYVRTEAFVIGYKKKALSDFQPILSYMVKDGYSESGAMASFEAEIYYGETILRSFTVCLRAPEVIRSGEYNNWRNKIVKVKRELIQTDQELHALSERSIESNQTIIFSYLVWPFILILALALKFGKAVSGWRAN